jgi:hypothetical protein
MKLPFLRGTETFFSKRYEQDDILDCRRFVRFNCFFFYFESRSRLAILSRERHLINYYASTNSPVRVLLRLPHPTLSTTNSKIVANQTIYRMIVASGTRYFGRSEFALAPTVSFSGSSANSTDFLKAKIQNVDWSAHGHVFFTQTAVPTLHCRKFEKPRPI